jgi:UDP-glucuronate 4-epimerase
MKILVTGSAGFIGSTTARKLLERGDEVVGIDNLNDYYDPTLKRDRLKFLESYDNFLNIELDIADKDGINSFFKKYQPQRVVHLAAQAGVRYSLKNPYSYIDSNITGFLNILEGIRHFGTEHLVYASTSSVYGANSNLPFSTSHNVDHPLSLYATTKRSNELMAHNYSQLFNIPVTGLRFFTVYGPWGRPDMALFLFTKKILKNQPIEVFNQGNHTRDFTYVDDIVEGVLRVLDKPAKADLNWNSSKPKPNTSSSPFKIYNIGSNNPQELMSYIEILEDKLGKVSEKIYLPLQKGDVPDTEANVDDLVEDFSYQPRTTINEGISNFVDWYLSYYGA